MDPALKAYIIGVGLSPDGLSVEDTMTLQIQYELFLRLGNGVYHQSPTIDRWWPTYDIYDNLIYIYLSIYFMSMSSL